MLARTPLREIWLNGRETNGHVAIALEKIAIVEKLEPRVRTIEVRVVQAMAAIALIMFAAPFVFAGLAKWGGWGCQYDP